MVTTNWIVYSVLGSHSLQQPLGICGLFHYINLSALTEIGDGIAPTLAHHTFFSWRKCRTTRLFLFKMFTSATKFVFLTNSAVRDLQRSNAPTIFIDSISFFASLSTLASSQLRMEK